jgi:branched-chain amino acid aminotransferase
MATLVNLDGVLVPPEEARVSVFDRGFLYGDSVYEVIRTYGGRPFELSRHLDRLEGSAARIGLPLPWSRERLGAELTRTLAASGNAESQVRVVVTRGAGELGLDPALAVDPLVILIVRELHPPPTSAYRDGVKAQLVGVRRAVDPRAKTGNYLSNLLALKTAREHGAYEALMVDPGGRITEGTSSNVFWVAGGALCTPPIEAGILEGITRAVVLEVARSLGIAVREEPLAPDALLAADEALVTGSVRELVPVVRVGLDSEEHTLGGGAPGPVVKRLAAAFRERAWRSVGLAPPGP